MPYPAKLSVESIAAAALDTVAELGLPALGVRPVAERLAVRPSALYRYVGDGLGLVALVAEAGAQRLRAQAVEALERGSRRRAGPPPATATARLHTMATAYREFAVREPNLYAAITTDTTTSAWTRQPGAERKALWNLLLTEVGAVTGDPDDTSAAVAVWSFLHGFAALGNAGLFGASGPRDGFSVGLEALCTGLARAHR